jgi:hypothetical protein
MRLTWDGLAHSPDVKDHPLRPAGSPFKPLVVLNGSFSLKLFEA